MGNSNEGGKKEYRISFIQNETFFISTIAVCEFVDRVQGNVFKDVNQKSTQNMRMPLN